MKQLISSTVEFIDEGDINLMFPTNETNLTGKHACDAQIIREAANEFAHTLLAASTLTSSRNHNLKLALEKLQECVMWAERNIQEEYLLEGRE